MIDYFVLIFDKRGETKSVQFYKHFIIKVVGKKKQQNNFQKVTPI